MVYRGLLITITIASNFKLHSRYIINNIGLLNPSMDHGMSYSRVWTVNLSGRPNPHAGGGGGEQNGNCTSVSFQLFDLFKIYPGGLSTKSSLLLKCDPSNLKTFSQLDNLF